MKNLKRNLGKDERGVEPTVMKILVGIILVVIGLGVGVTVYERVGDTTTSYLDCSMTVSPSSDTIATGSNDSVSVNVDSTVGYEDSVSLSVDWKPENVAISFSPETGTPNFGSTMSISVGPNAPAGTHTITVKGASGDKEMSDTYELTIE